MDKRQIGYKVLVKDNGKLYSCCLPEGLRIEYPEGKEVRPLDGWGPLAVFSNETMANGFIIWCSNISFNTHIVKECEYQEADLCKYETVKAGSSSEYATLYFPRQLIPEEHKGCWPAGFCREGRAYASFVPPGTIFADVVKVLSDDTT